MSRKQVSDNALKVMYRLNKEGFEAYLVGGCVRDILLGQSPKDFDVATNAHPEQIRRLFRNCHLIGRRFRLAHVRFHKEIIEVSTFRADANAVSAKRSKAKDPNNIYGSLEEDVWRRDFTVNALYYRVSDFAIV